MQSAESTSCVLPHVGYRKHNLLVQDLPGITAYLSEQTIRAETSIAHLRSASHMALEWSLQAAQCPAVCAGPPPCCSQLQ